MPAGDSRNTQAALDTLCAPAADAAVLHLARERRDLAVIAATAADSLAYQFEVAEAALSRDLAPAPVLTTALSRVPPRGLGHGG